MMYLKLKCFGPENKYNFKVKIKFEFSNPQIIGQLVQTNGQHDDILCQRTVKITEFWLKKCFFSQG